MGLNWPHVTPIKPANTNTHFHGRVIFFSPKRIICVCVHCPPPLPPSPGYIHSRVEEEYLWDCKQLGAYSPTVLLNTLLFFCSKFLGFTSVRQHRRLSFAHFMRCSRTNADGSKTVFLRFYPPAPLPAARHRPEPPGGRGVSQTQWTHVTFTDTMDTPPSSRVHLIPDLNLTVNRIFV